MIDVIRFDTTVPNRIAKRQETLPPPSVTISELLSSTHSLPKYLLAYDEALIRGYLIFSTAPLAETLPQQPSTIVSPPVVLPSTGELRHHDLSC